MARDNFKKGDITKLSQRVALRCSNPDCRVPTAAPGESELGVNSIGVAAHIHAASPGGPRYDPSMTSSERGSISNAIWLCSNCSIIIDRDKARYTAKLLKEWKANAEATAIKEQGMRLPSDEDAIQQTTMALTGLPKKILAKAIPNIHTATAKAIENSDPRFEVITRYKDGQTVFEYRAKEDVTFNFEVKGEEGVESLRKMFEEGQDAKLPAKCFNVKGIDFPGGSPDRLGHVEIRKDGIEAIHRIWLINPKENVTEQFNDVHGKVFFGTKAMRFEGNACSGLFKFSYSRPLAQLDESSSFNISINFALWEGKEVSKLPYFNKIKNFFDNVFYGAELHTSLEINGDTAFEANTERMSEVSEFRDIDRVLVFIDKARIISEKLKHKIHYKQNCFYSEKEVLEICNVANILSGKLVNHEEILKANSKISLILDFDGSEAIDKLKIGSSTDLRIEEEGGVLEIFGEKISLPNKITYINAVYLKPLEDLMTAKKGSEISFECLPDKGHKIEYQFKLNSEKL
ncbi:hypothetical protein [Vreelandella sulfidaeris]|uniref:hypothetical protein n=1 Tax=Vreelandella sulfidaeris TaxID=115553 RepID=UPI0035F0480E